MRTRERNEKKKRGTFEEISHANTPTMTTTTNDSSLLGGHECAQLWGCTHQRAGGGTGRMALKAKTHATHTAHT
ncbi:hypothetical protein NECAME_16841, partial [Necator americanus]